jgi:hypothetical protein
MKHSNKAIYYIPQLLCGKTTCEESYRQNDSTRIFPLWDYMPCVYEPARKHQRVYSLSARDYDLLCPIARTLTPCQCQNQSTRLMCALLSVRLRHSRLRISLAEALVSGWNGSVNSMLLWNIFSSRICHLAVFTEVDLPIASVKSSLGQLVALSQIWILNHGIIIIISSLVASLRTSRIVGLNLDLYPQIPSSFAIRYFDQKKFCIYLP